MDRGRMGSDPDLGGKGAEGCTFFRNKLLYIPIIIAL
jgi:hypothetical protein